MTPGSWQVASPCGTWLWWPWRPRRGSTPCGARVRACRWHTDWRGQRRSIHPELPQSACLDEMTWPSGRTLKTSDPWGRMRLYGLCKTESLEALACIRSHRSRRYRWILATLRKTALVSIFSPKFLVILSTRRTSCKDMHGSKLKLLISHQSELAYYMVAVALRPSFCSELQLFCLFCHWLVNGAERHG